MLAAPGHDMGALVFYNPEHRILISGDALWQNGYGFVMPRAMDSDALPATRATLDMIAALDVRTVIPGHGEVFTDVAAALERAYQRTAAFEADDERVARHALKVVLTFSLLARRSLRLAGVRVPAGRRSSATTALGLTSREQELLVLVGRGLTNIEIARRLGLGRPTVARIVASAMDKVGADRRAQLAAFVATR